MREGGRERTSSWGLQFSGCILAAVSSLYARHHPRRFCVYKIRGAASLCRSSSSRRTHDNRGVVGGIPRTACDKKRQRSVFVSRLEFCARHAVGCRVQRGDAKRSSPFPAVVNIYFCIHIYRETRVMLAASNTNEFRHRIENCKTKHEHGAGGARTEQHCLSSIYYSRVNKDNQSELNWSLTRKHT